MEIRNNGRGRAEDEQVIPHFQWPEKTDGTHISSDAHEFRALLERFYALRGWDAETGHPTRAKLVQLGLGDVAASLYGEGPLTE
jgi:aldehyde:ferredoxin oxidoreductase